MALPMVVLATSAVCGVCERIRKPTDGKLTPLALKDEKPAAYEKRVGYPPAVTFPGFGQYDVAFFRQLIMGGKDGPAKFRVCLLQFANMNGTWKENSVIEISIIELDGDGVKQTMFKPSGDKTSLESYRINSKQQKIISRTDPVQWSTTVSVYVPNGIIRYLFFFPAFYFFDGGLWDEAIKTSGPLYGLVNGLSTIQSTPWGIASSEQPKIINTLEMTSRLVSNPQELLPPPEAKPDVVPAEKPAAGAASSAASFNVCAGGLRLQPASRF